MDSHSVCTFAGFTAVPIPFPGVEHATSAIFLRYAAQLRKPDSTALTIIQKRDQLAFIFANELSFIHDMSSFKDSQQYEFQLTVAGYDPDGKAMVAWSDLRIAPGQSDWLVSVTGHGEEEIRGKLLTTKTRGINDVADGILAHPEAYASDQAISKYRTSVKDGHALTLAEMKDLASALERETSKTHPAFVGGDDQIAVLAHGSVVELDQVKFPVTPYRTHDINIVDENIFDPEPAPNIVGPTPDVINVYINNSFRQKNVLLDGSYFASNSFQHCIIVYNGGDTIFAPDQDVSSSTLAIGTHVDLNSSTASHLVRDYHWANFVISDDGLKTPAWKSTQ